MGFLKDKYGEPDDIKSANSKWIKFATIGQQYSGVVSGFQEGRYGTEVIFADGKLLTLNLSTLLREVVAVDPGPGDRLEITYLADEPLPAGQDRSPTKLFRVRVARAAPAAFEDPVTVPDDELEPF